MTLTGEMLIGFAAVRGTQGAQRAQRAFNPAAGADISEPEFGPQAAVGDARRLPASDR
jgi:alpha-ketoglutaric semialdehyde dehydrogenase